MASRHQNPDDLTCRPAAFSTVHNDITERTYFIRNDWHLASTKVLGELIVVETPNTTFLKIVMEPQ